MQILTHFPALRLNNFIPCPYSATQGTTGQLVAGVSIGDLTGAAKGSGSLIGDAVGLIGCLVVVTFTTTGTVATGLIGIFTGVLTG